jgi:predicted ATP-grasp superfamily ATP-dependent carboligase
MGWIGYADVDLIQDPRDNVAKVMEVNPRITGSVKIAFAAGVDFAEMVVRQAMGWQIDSCLDYQAGQYLRYFYKDILWFLSSPDRWQAQPSWFRFFAGDTVDQIFSLRDPMPSVTHGGRSLLQMLRYLLKPSSHGTAAK